MEIDPCTSIAIHWYISRSMKIHHLWTSVEVHGGLCTSREIEGGQQKFTGMNENPWKFMDFRGDNGDNGDPLRFTKIKGDEWR